MFRGRYLTVCWPRGPEAVPKALTDGLNKWLVGMGREKVFKMIHVDRSDDLEEVRM